jgi:hypothetical protein
MSKFESYRRILTNARWKRVSLAIALIVALTFVVESVLWFFGPWFFARETAKADRHLGAIPTALRDTTSAPLKPARIERFDTSFQVPWDGIEVEKDGTSFVLILFKNGPSFMFFKPGSGISSNRIQANRFADGTRLDSLFDPKALSSEYDWENTILSATPDQIKWWNRPQNQRLALLLGLKSTEMNENTAISSISDHELHGFEIGDPESSFGSVHLKLYDANDRLYEFTVTPRKGIAPPTQTELNAFILSLRPIPHS